MCPYLDHTSVPGVQVSNRICALSLSELLIDEAIRRPGDKANTRNNMEKRYLRICHDECRDART